MPPAARVGDIHVCTTPTPKPHVGGPINGPGSPQVKSNGLAQARGTDPCTCTPPAPPNFIVTGAGQVLVDGLPAARETDKTMHPPPGMIQKGTGSPDILIGGPTVGVTLGNKDAGTKNCNAIAAKRPGGSKGQKYDNNCGVEQSRMLIWQAKGNQIGEDDLLNKAITDGNASDNTPSAPKAKGETNPDQRKAILKSYDIDSSLQDNSMQNIMQAVAEGKGVISAHDTSVLYGPDYYGSHAIGVIGITYDANGNPQTVITNDTDVPAKLGGPCCGMPVPIDTYENSLKKGAKINVTDNPIYGTKDNLTALSVAAPMPGEGYHERIMPTPTPSITADTIRRIAGATSNAVLPDEDGETFPIPVRVDGRVVILVMYFKVQGPRDHRAPQLPYYAMHLDRETGKVLRFWALTPDELGIRPPLEPVSGARNDPSMSVQEYTKRRERFLALSPELWTAFAAGGTRVSPAVAAAAREYTDLFLAIANETVAPYYLAASPAYFQWLHAVAAP